jgi:hypothetical protein
LNQIIQEFWTDRSFQLIWSHLLIRATSNPGFCRFPLAGLPEPFNQVAYPPAQYAASTYTSEKTT